MFVADSRILFIQARAPQYCGVRRRIDNGIVASYSLLKLNVKKRYRFKKATLYEREVIKKQKFFIRRQKLPYSYNMS
jgi:ribosomal protein S17